MEKLPPAKFEFVSSHLLSGDHLNRIKAFSQLYTQESEVTFHFTCNQEWMIPYSLYERYYNWLQEQETKG